ncbi:Hypothetical predicted protein [Lecanosticta acicola]|uniref:Uncharacterized protein n=1 Tax=Lecanosticta acicola TaxID=111012 RepID=A0AAI8Z5I6_9PEZI|nr:Hypothetical predicted protein [Lecanosticta acicola]
MAHTISDRWLWLGFGIFFLAALKGVQYAISDIIRLTELKPQASLDDDGDKDPEDTISLTTLGTLATSPNPSIATAAKSIIIRRFAGLPNATEILETDLHSKNDVVRRRARQAVAYLDEWDEDIAPDQFDVEELPPASGGYIRQEEMREVGRLRRQIQLLEGSGMSQDDVDLAMEGIMSRLEELGFSDVSQLGLASPIVGLNADAEARRNRREAIVLHEGAGRIEEDDIIQPVRDR